MNHEKEIQAYEAWLMTEGAKELLKAYNQCSGQVE